MEHSVCTGAGFGCRNAQGIRVLVVSDVCWMREALAVVLKADPAISSVELSADLVGALAITPVMTLDAVLLDATLPCGHSEVRRSREIAPNAPPIIAFGVRQGHGLYREYDQSGRIRPHSQSNPCRRAGLLRPGGGRAASPHRRPCQRC